MATIKKTVSVKAFSGTMSKVNRTEWEMAFNTNPKRGKVYDQWELLDMFDRCGEACGASKAVHLLAHIVVKRHQVDGYIPNVRREKAHGNKVADLTGNQLIDEVNCWLKYMGTDYADLLCPVLKYFTSKSDKVSATSETMQHNVLIIAQKAVKVGDASYACRKAAQLNAEQGYHGEDAEDRYEKLKAFSKLNGWRDAMHNPGNSGVIFDYADGCYKAVFIDYAL